MLEPQEERAKFLELMRRHGISYDVRMGYVGAGWLPILDRLIPRLQLLGWDGRLLQVKSKFGGLRFYVSQPSEALHRAIRGAEDESCKTCEECGAPGIADSWAGKENSGWIMTLCPQHGEARRSQNASR
jgi:hypothetical protein